VIGGGHNGLVNALISRAREKGARARAPARARRRGGDGRSVSRFQVFCLLLRRFLLRPEIIRELDLPRHGLEILPLDGTFTPMPNGDYLWRVNDHARTRREIARHSRSTPKLTTSTAKP
jgi:phytoene dehydrogenase-like protein